MFIRPVVEPGDMSRLTLALVLLVLTSGCIGFLTGQEALTFEASTALTDDSVAANAGYERNETRTVSINRTLEAAGQSRQVTVRNKVATYEKSLSLGPLGSAKLGVFALVSSPAVEVAGETLNPVGDYDNDRLVGLFASNYGGLSDVSQVSERTVTTLGSETTVTKYAATATFSGRQVDVYVHVTKVRHESDFVVALGVYPQALSGEESNVLELIRAVEHPA